MTQLEAPRQTSHRFPQFLPDGRHFLFFASGEPEAAGIYLASLDGGKPKRLTAADSAGGFLKPNGIAFVGQGALVVRQLDLARGDFIGEPVTLANDVGMEVGFAPAFSISADGLVAYRSGEAVANQLTWFDRAGKALNVVSPPDPALQGYPQLSPDERRVALYRGVAGNPDIWLLDLVRGGMVRLTSEPTNDSLPLWSPDGTQIVYNSNPKGMFDLFIKPSAGAGPSKPLFENSNFNRIGQHWSSNGFLAYFEVNPKTGRDLWVLNMNTTGNEQKTRVVANTPFDETMAEFSPDGHWLAYQTNESGRFEIVVQPFPELSSKAQISTEGGIAPRWRPDGKEIYFVAPDGKLMAVSVKSFRSMFDAGPPTALFQTRIMAVTGVAQVARPQYAVSRDGRFLVNQPIEQPANSPITVILDWKPKAVQ